MRLRAPAKLNLGLRIVARRPDGYHEIETVFVPLCLFDLLEVEAVSEPGVSLELVGGGDLPTGDDNLAVRAAREAARALDHRGGLRLRLEKHIPIAAGLGGGSSDAAAALRAVELLAGRELETAARAELALELGADVPFFLDPRPAVGRGLGERLEPLPDWPSRFWVLVTFPFGVATGGAYAAASRELTLPRDASSIAALVGPLRIVRPGAPAVPGEPDAAHNDLESVAARRHPEIREARQALGALGAELVGMSGSGPTVYGLFGARAGAERAAAQLALPPGARARVVRSPASGERDWAGSDGSIEFGDGA